jgi:hypothetical protein
MASGISFLNTRNGWKSGHNKDQSNGIELKEVLNFIRYLANTTDFRKLGILNGYPNRSDKMKKCPIKSNPLVDNCKMEFQQLQFTEISVFYYNTIAFGGIYFLSFLAVNGNLKKYVILTIWFKLTLSDVIKEYERKTGKSEVFNSSKK